jgi:hypothetical protein
VNAPIDLPRPGETQNPDDNVTGGEDDDDVQRASLTDLQLFARILLDAGVPLPETDDDERSA